jgi:hypothetical protein
MERANRRTLRGTPNAQSEDLPLHVTGEEGTPDRRTWWPACPDENPQRLLTIVGYRVKAPDLIQALVLLTQQDNGVCQAPFVEHDDRVEVRAVACCKSKLGYDAIEDQPATAWPSNAPLASPLGNRIVVDVDTGLPLRRYILGRPTGSADSYSLFIPFAGECAWIPEDER